MLNVENLNMYTMLVKLKKKYEASLVSSRLGINISEEDLEKLNELISPLILKGQSIKNIYKYHKDEIPCKISCLYNYIDAGLLTVRNIDLPRKVKHKVRNKSNSKKDYSYRIGRTYADFKKLIEENPTIHIVEMDTVIGKSEQGKVLLTLLFRNFNFMIARLLTDKSANSVKAELDNIERIIGQKLFKRVFNYILTDNGRRISEAART